MTFKNGGATMATVSPDFRPGHFLGFGFRVGSYSITAVYNGDSNFTGSTSSPVSQVVNSSTSTTLSSSALQSVYGQSVTFTATVSAVSPITGTPSGTVTFMAGLSSMGTGTLSSGHASFTVPNLAVGSYSITAVYGGNGSNYTASTSSAVSQTVAAASTTTALSASVNPSVFGQSTTFTAVVTATSPGSGTPTGTVTFRDGSTTLGIVTLSAGQASYTTAALTVASHSITAVYNGSTDYATSYASVLSQVVNTNTSTTLTSSVAPSLYGQATTFTATVSAVSPITGTPSGTVIFEMGSTSIGSGTLSSGQASFSTSSLPVGSDSISAVYVGNSTYTTSTSTALAQTVNQDATTTTLTSGTNPSIHDHSVTYTSTVAVSGTGTGTPGGSVELLDGTTVAHHGHA